MEKIKQKPFESIKTAIIILLTASMLILAGIYIGGSQFADSTAALLAKPLPSGTVPAGAEAETEISVYEKALLPISFAGIRYMGNGGGTYGSEAAATDLFAFAAEPIHTCLSSPSMISKIDSSDFEKILASEI